ncbi:pyruvyl transferase [Pseudomonas fluvialis]|uniref:ExoV-like protein n=1 Tax=Pseudomonas fluvialis TaxID=1793966 RepID=A0ABQ2AMR6_9PSED|nr:polysaccharide pyruvyl transferase family protein [Pseudomonas fluvialis]OXM41814.1 pyruvyl transferase [Pseudomonas fluvialis]GGH93912.1 exoV-like protein [Pseudomonas fluvialis]
MAIKLYWHRGSGRSDAGQRNFGDYLSPLIVEAVSGCSVKYAPLKEAEMMAIGTILANEYKAKRYGFKRKIHVWGSGCGQPDERFSSRHYYHAVRGKETAQRVIGQPVISAFGDPGLLAEMLVKRPIQKKYKIGFVAHYVDRDRPEAIAFAATDGVHSINVFDEPRDVLHQIAACEFIVSSSLHGLVVADAYGVPNLRVRLSRGLIDELKFDDYYSAFNLSAPQPLTSDKLASLAAAPEWIADGYSRPGLAGIQDGLIKHFPKI